MGIIGKYRLFYDNNKTIFVTIFKAAVFFSMNLFIPSVDF